MVELLKFRCDTCGRDSSLEIVYTNATYLETFSMCDDAEPEFEETSVDDYGDEAYFGCSTCGSRIPVDATGENAWEDLRDWLQRRPENVAKIMEEL